MNSQQRQTANKHEIELHLTNNQRNVNEDAIKALVFVYQYVSGEKEKKPQCL